MPSVDNLDGDIFGLSGTRFLSPSASSSPRKSPSRQSINARRSTASLRGSLNLPHGADGNVANGQHSLAHELAVALMPEPSEGSKLLAEEFGIEYDDEGAQGIDDDAQADHQNIENIGSSFADELRSTVDASFEPPSPINTLAGYEETFGSPTPSRRQLKQPRQDAMDVLAQNLESTDKFLSHLRGLDVDSTSSSSQPSLEKLASEVIRRLNETTRDRETQVRELLGYEREFRKIAGEVGGSDVLSQLEELDGVNDLSDQTRSAEGLRSVNLKLESVTEEPTTPSHNLSHEWEMDPDQQRLGDDEDFEPDLLSPIKDSFPPPPPVDGPMTPSQAISQFAHIRTFTTSLVSSLTTISEQAQVNGAATTEAGRKIRALKNKIGGWRTDWDGAERSRVRIERWEAGIVDADPVYGSPSTPPRLSRRVDGRKLVQEHLQAFERALVEAGQKTQAIMAAS
jgi:hypothetical protein